MIGYVCISYKPSQECSIITTLSTQGEGPGPERLNNLSKWQEKRFELQRKQSRVQTGLLTLNPEVFPPGILEVLWSIRGFLRI